MAKDTSKQIAEKEVEKIKKSAEVNEAYFVGLLWSNPFDNYSEYSDNIEQEEFIHDVWGFFYELGKRMFKEGIKTFDTITVNKFIKDLNVESEFEKYGKLETIDDVIDIVKDNSDNIEFYYESIKKSYTVKQLFLLFGDKVLIDNGKYQYEKMTREQLTIYWTDKMNQIVVSGTETNYDVEDLYVDADEFITKLQQDAEEMLPFYKSGLLNHLTQGMPKSAITMLGGYGGTGKSSIMADKVVMSCIANNEKLLIILNEEDAQAFRQKIVLSILFHEFGTGFDRTRMVNGKLQDSDKELIRKAFKRLDELLDSEHGSIKILFMQKYDMKDLEKIIRFYANRGFTNICLDTHKQPDNSEYDESWRSFVEASKMIYRFTRKNAGGYSLRTFLTFQLADSTLKSRYLSYDNIGVGKMMKNEASTVIMFRAMFDDEYPEQKKELFTYNLKKNDLTGKYEKVPYKLEKDKVYYLFFLPKCRTGASNSTGAPVLVIEPLFNFNAFKEVCYCFVPRDYV